ncbi:PREDICTED: probable (S)-N-methylcoclaurine 3'-hydroxylase isozyme 2 [Nelumbo nucifera]|nr:PREDICTED: probable (S)-N-methylcoclaurine 3'-hydroxylase isozyme 2 [Nelumbo nucifera]
MAEIMRKIQDELDDVVGKNSTVEELHIPKLHCLDAVVKENLRLHLVAPLLLPRHPSKSCYVARYTIPEGAQVLVNAWGIHRDPEAWDNPLEFHPESFLTKNGKWDYSGNNFHYFPFGTGRRICAGIPLAKRLLPYVLASLLHLFERRFADGTEIDMLEKTGITLKKMIPLVVVPKPRLLLEKYGYWFCG